MTTELTTSPEQNAFELAQREAKAISRSSLVPKIYQGDSGIPNCLIALNLARRMGADPLMVMQNLNVIQGRPGFGASFLIASVNSCGNFTKLRYEFKGEMGTREWSCRSWAIEKDTKERLEGSWVSWGMAKDEGWVDKSGSKWKTMPEQMIRYRAASFWQRAYAPELSMGLLSSEELQDITPMQARVIPEETRALEEALMSDDDILDVTDADPPHTHEHSEDDPI